MRRAVCFLSALFLVPTAAAAQTGIIDTVAGGGPNNLPALSASLSNPAQVALDKGGNLYITSAERHRVFRVDTSGFLTVVAGSGVPGFSGDGGPATQAMLLRPRGVAVDATGNILIADSANQRVRRVDATTGIITTVAGTGLFGFSGDGGPATSARLGLPTGVAVGAAGNLYIADLSNERVRRVSAGADGLVTGAADEIITTVAGTGSRGFSGDGGPATSAGLFQPIGVALDAYANLFIADRNNQRIRRVDAATGIITTVAGNGVQGFSGDGGPATSASLGSPTGVAVDANGTLYIADFGNQRVRRVDAATGIIITVAGTGDADFRGDGGPATSARMRFPQGVAVDADRNLFIADTENQRIRRVDAATGTISTVAGNGTFGFSGDGGPSTNASLFDPRGVALDADGNLFILDRRNHSIRRVDAATGIITTVAGNGLEGPSGDEGPATSARLRFPNGLALDADGNLYIADGSQRVRRVSVGADGVLTGANDEIITTVAGTGVQGFGGDGGLATSATLNFPFGMVLDSAGNLFIADINNHRIRRVDAATGIITTVAGTGVQGFSGDGGPATAASLSIPQGVALDAHGNLFIADTGNRRVRRLDAATSIITTAAGNGLFGFSGDGGPATDARLGNPAGVAVDESGNLFIADQFNNRIRRVDAAIGIITTVAGNGVFGLGDGGPATDARLAFPAGVTVGAGKFFIADTNNERIRRVESVDAPEPDTTPPVIECAGPDGAWQASNVSLACTARDDDSGLADPADANFSLTTNVPAGTETSNASTGTRQVCDAAGNCATAGPIGGNKVDKKAPQVACGTADDLWRATDVSIACNANDGGSGLANPADANFSLTTNVPAGTETSNASTGTRQVCDAAGNCATAGPIGGNKVDKKAPQVACGTADGLWHATDVSVACNANDGGSGLANLADANFSLTTNAPAGTETSNASTGTRQVCDAAGNCATAGPIAGNKVDKKAPTIIITAPEGSYLLNQAAAANYACADGGSGLATCAGAVANGSNFDTSSVGAKSFTVNATDNVGNASSRAANYNVTYKIPMLFDNTTAKKSGSVFAIRLQLADVNGTNRSAEEIVVTATRIVRVSDSAPAPLDDAGKANPDSNFRFDPALGGTGGYVFNLNTQGLSTGTYLLFFTAAGDPVEHSLEFQVK